MRIAVRRRKGCPDVAYARRLEQVPDTGAPFAIAVADQEPLTCEHPAGRNCGTRTDEVRVSNPPVLLTARMIRTAILLVRDLLHFVALACSTRASLAAENVFLRKPLAFYVERKAKSRRLNDTARIALVDLARLIDWRQLLVVVRSETLVRWHRQGFRYSGGGSHGALGVRGFLATCRT
jgi:hypothetical protein